jgi:hypothetical protein
MPTWEAAQFPNQAYERGWPGRVRHVMNGHGGPQSHQAISSLWPCLWGSRDIPSLSYSFDQMWAR